MGVALGEERPFEETATLVMKEIFVPAILDELGNHNDDVAAGIFLREFQDVLDNRNDHETIG